MIDNMIAWAKSRIGCPDYAGWCLSFIEDALEISNDIEIFGGDSAKESCELYRDALRDGIPEKGAFVFYDCMCPGEDGPVNWGHCGIALEDGNVIHAWDRVRIDDYLATAMSTPTLEKQTVLLPFLVERIVQFQIHGCNLLTVYNVGAHPFVRKQESKFLHPVYRMEMEKAKRY